MTHGRSTATIGSLSVRMADARQAALKRLAAIVGCVPEGADDPLPADEAKRLQLELAREALESRYP